MTNEDSKPLTLRALLDRSFRLYGDLPSIGSVGESPISYSQLGQRIQELASSLARGNVRRGDRVAILGENSPNWVTAYLAITWMGAVVVPILPGFPETDARHIIRNSEAVAVFTDPKQRAKIEGIEDSALHTIHALEDFKAVEVGKSRFALLEKTMHLFKRGRGPEAFGAIPPEEIAPPAPDDLAAIIYTSGTTGFSKGVMLTHRSIVFDVLGTLEKFPAYSYDRFLSILPLAHTFEATVGMLSPLAVGASIYYLKGLPTPQKLLEAMGQVKPTGMMAVPLVIDKIYRKKVLPQIQKKWIVQRLYALPFFRKKLHRIAGKKLLQSFGGNFRFFAFGGASLNEDVETFLREAGIPYAVGYGMTETAPLMTVNPLGKGKLGSCGRPIAGIEMAIHEPAAETGIGEIIVRGPIVMRGYYKNAEETRKTFLEGGWLKTGDLGCFDTEGYLYIKGRSKNVIIGPSGENIYPEIIEQKLMQSPYIQEAVVFASDERIMAKAYLDYDILDHEFARNKLSNDDARKLAAEILENRRKEVNRQLPTFSQINRILEHPEPFEKTPTNKVKRFLYVPTR